MRIITFLFCPARANFQKSVNKSELLQTSIRFSSQRASHTGDSSVMPAVSLGFGQMLLARVSPLAQHHLLRPPLNAHTRCLHPGCIVTLTENYKVNTWDQNKYRFILHPFNVTSKYSRVQLVDCSRQEIYRFN